MLNTIRVFRCLIMFFLIALGSTGCSSDAEKREAGSTKKVTDQLAQKAIQEIKQPLEKAQHAQDLANSHIKAIDDAVKENRP